MKKILIIKHGSLGDIVSATSILKDIRDHYINDKIFIVTSNKFKNFFLESPLVNDIIIDDRNGLLKTVNVISKILKLKVDLVIDLQNSHRTTIYELFLRLFSSVEINGTGIFSSIRYRCSSSNLVSVIDGLSNQIEILGIKSSRKPFLDWLSDHSFDSKKIYNKKFMIINPGCSKDSSQKKWPAKKYAKICQYLISKNILPVLIGTTEEEKEIKYIENNTSEVLNLCNKSSLPVIYEISKKAIGSISNDTGPAHLIASSGCKILLILSTFSNTHTVIPKGNNVFFIQKERINDIAFEEVVSEINKIFKL